MSLLEFDPSGCIDADSGITDDQIASMADAMEQARETFLQEFDHPGDSFFSLPMQQYLAYQDTREASELGRIFEVGTSMRDEIDAVVVVGSRSATSAARAVMTSCCDPHHNERARADRGSRPRIYFIGDRFDNDSVAALIHHLGQRDYRDTAAQTTWAIVAMDADDDADETVVVLDVLIDALTQSLGQSIGSSETDKIQHFVLPITTEGSRVDRRAGQLGCERVFHVPANQAERQRELSVTALLPAAMLGLDCIKLLEGAVMINDHFKSAPFRENHVLQWVAVHHLLAKHRGLARPRLRSWPDGLRWVGPWYDQLRAAHRIKPAHEMDASRSLTTHLVAHQFRYDPVVAPVTDPVAAGDGRDLPLPAKMLQAMEAAAHADRQAGLPSLTLRVPSTDIRVVGQLFQMLMIATKMEAKRAPLPF